MRVSYIYINTLIDAFYLTENDNYIEQIEQIIRGTVHPQDDMATRQFDDIEFTWFYTVFFQAVIRYLNVKEELIEYDTDYYYARSSLIVYARWMADNETPYLDTPERLDYPNDTWAAQEIRKANILFYAALYSTENRQLFLDKADFFYNYVTATVTASDTRHFSRILALLMQNHGPNRVLFAELITKADERMTTVKMDDIESLQYLSTTHILKQMTADFAKLLVRFNLKKELRWLSVRSATVKQLLERTKLAWLVQIND